MKRGIIILVALVLISCVSALPSNSLHLNIQTVDASGGIESGTYTFNFTIYTDSLCTAGIYSREFTRATDSRGIADFYLDNTESIDFSSQLYLGYSRGGVLKNCSEIARIPYSNTAGKLLNESNQNIAPFNFTARFLKGDGSELTGISTFNSTYAGLINNASYLSTYNETYAGLINNESYLSTFNATYDALTSGNVSWNESYANTLYLPHTTIWDTLFNNTLVNFLTTWLSGLTTDDLTEGAINKYDNQSWNETRGNELYSGIEWDYNQTLATYNLWNEEWSSTYNETYSGLINNASYLSTFNQTYHDKVTDNESWSETYANTLYLPHTTIWDTLFNNTLTNFLTTWLGTKTTDDLTEGATNKYDNQSWNETRGDELYADIDDAFDKTNVAYLNETNTFSENVTIGGCTHFTIGSTWFKECIDMSGECGNTSDRWIVKNYTSAIEDGEYCR